MHTAPQRATPAPEARVQTEASSYCCHYTPLDRDGYPVPSDSGVQPSLRVQARSAEEARRLAFATVRCPIGEVERLEPAEPAWPFGPLTDLQRRDRAALERALRSGRMSGFEAAPL